MFPGTVIEVASATGWGNVVLVRTDDWVREFVADWLNIELEVLDVQYAHLTNVSVVAGDVMGYDSCRFGD